MAQMSGVKTVASAGTAEPLGTVSINGPLIIKALSTNNGLVYLGDDGTGDVSSSNGFSLTKNETLVLNYVGNLNTIWVDVATNGEGVCWIALGENPKFG